MLENLSLAYGMRVLILVAALIYTAAALSLKKKSPKYLHDEDDVGRSAKLSVLPDSGDLAHHVLASGEGLNLTQITQFFPADPVTK